MFRTCKFFRKNVFSLKDQKWYFFVLTTYQNKITDYHTFKIFYNTILKINASWKTNLEYFKYSIAWKHKWFQNSNYVANKEVVNEKCIYVMTHKHYLIILKYHSNASI